MRTWGVFSMGLRGLGLGFRAVGFIYGGAWGLGLKWFGVSDLGL